MDVAAMMVLAGVGVFLGGVVVHCARIEMENRAPREKRSLKVRAKAIARATDEGVLKALGAMLRSTRAYAKRIDEAAGKK